MKILLKTLPLLIIMGLLTGCAPSKQFVPFPDQTKRIEDPKKARIYVVRPTTFGGAVTMDVHDGNKPIGQTGPKGYLCWERDPGNLNVVGKAENTTNLSLKVEKGMVYYIQQHVRMGILFARNKLSQLTENEGKSKLGECSPPTVIR